MGAGSDYVKTNTMGTLSAVNGSGDTLTSEYDKGDLSIEGLRPRQNALKTIQARGRHISEAYGEREYATVQFTAFVPNAAGDTISKPGTLLEILMGLGVYASATSTTGVNRPHAVDLTLTIEGSAYGDTADETITMENVHCTASLAESADGNTVTISGTVLGKITIGNGANTMVFQEIGPPATP